MSSRVSIPIGRRTTAAVGLKYSSPTQSQAFPGEPSQGATCELRNVVGRLHRGF